ncbi:MAG: glycosyl hydrolase [Anaerolineae bacterium]
MTQERLFLAVTGSGLARAECDMTGNWLVDHLLEGQDVRCMAADPLNRGVVYAGTQGNGVLVSRDMGQSWKTAGLAGHIVKSLAVSQHEPGVIYAGTKPACVFITRDGGGNWAELTGFRRIRGRRWWRSPAEPPDWRAYVQAISISPVDPHVIVAGIEFGAVVRSVDGGQSWSNHRKGAVRDCHSLTFHARSGDWVYEAGGGGAAVSRDGGHSWQQPRQGLDRRYAWACAADPEHPEVWYISAGPFGWKGTPQAHVDGAANSYIYRKSAGAPWERLSGGLPQPLDYMAYALLTDPDAAGHLYAGLSNGEVWQSADYGDTWHSLPFNLGRIQRLIMLGGIGVVHQDGG